MKKIIISIICISIVIAGFILYNIFTPKITRESVISEFNNNKKHFTIVRDYLMTKKDNYYINNKTYHDDIKDENVKKSVDYLIQKIGYKEICIRFPMSATGISKEIIFVRENNSDGEFGIEYDCTPAENIPSEDVKLGDGWYFYHASGT